jgi:exopolysaccharide production protein ExoZ
MKESSQKFYGVQILRAIAALLVVFFHIAQANAKIAPGGWGSYHPQGLLNGSFGVDIFFAISGMVLYLSASSLVHRMDRKHAWKEFLWRRVLRVVPLYYLFTTLKLLLFLAVPAAFDYNKNFSLWHIIASYLFLPAYNVQGAPVPILPAGWTLSYEMLFYIVITLALFAWQPILRFAVLILVPLAIAGYIIPRSWGGLTYLAHPIEAEFLFGMLVGVCVQRRYALPAWAAVGAMVLMFVTVLSGPQAGQVGQIAMPRFLLWGIPAALILLSITSLESVYSFRRHRYWLLLGDSSYVLYLSHDFVVPGVAFCVRRLGLTGFAGAGTNMICGCGLSIAVAVILHLWLERPMLRFLGERRLPWSLISADSASVAR